MLADQLAVLLGQLRREVRHEERLEQRQIRNPRREHAIDQVELGVRDEHREQVSRQALAGREPTTQLLVGWDVLGRAIERLLVEIRQQIEERLAVLAAAQPLHRQQRALQVVVLHARRADLLRELAQQRVAALARDHARLHERREQDLEVDLVIAAVDAGRVVDRVGVAAPAVQRVLGARALRDREVRAFADDLRAQLDRVDAHVVVDLVADLAVRLAARLDVRADAAEPHQVDLEREDRAHDVGAGDDVRRQPEQRLGLARQRDLLRRALEHATAAADRVLAIVRPLRARRREHALALDERRRRIRLGIEEHVLVVERGDQAQLVVEQHAVAEHVAAHVADAGDLDRRLAMSMPISRKCRSTFVQPPRDVMPMTLWS